MPRQRFDPLGSELLDSFDLAFIDQKTYDELSAHERADFKRSIQNGLGVICLLHDPQEKMLGEFLKVTTKKSSLDTVHMHFTSSHNYVLPVLPIELNPDASILPVVQSKTRILSGYFFVGQGKMGFQFIQETFRLGMAGNASDYAFAWTDLLQKTARTQETPFQLELTTPFPYYPDEPLDTNVTSFGEDFALHADGVRVPLEENIFVDDSWNGRTWAGKSGWHQLHIKHDATQLNYFVSEAGEWTSLMLANQMRENQVSQAPAITQQRIIVPAPVPMLLFYLIFVFASAFLWLAPKI
jgi:hypothetical protein